MEEILASIRKIIAEEPVGSRPGLSRGSDGDEPSTTLPPPSDDESTHGSSYSVEDALADLMDDAPQRRTVRTGEREVEREPAPKPQGQPATPSETAGHRPSWLFGRASDSLPGQQQRGEPETPQRLAGSLRGQLDSLRSAPERATDNGDTAEARPDAAKSADPGSLFDRPRAAAPSGLASFPTPPASPSQDIPRPASQRVPARDAGLAGVPGERTGADVRGASKPAAGAGSPEAAPPPAGRASEPTPEAGPHAAAPRTGPSAGPAAAPVRQQGSADQRQEAKERAPKPVLPPLAGSGQPTGSQPRSDVPQTAAPSAPRPSEPRADAPSRPSEQSAAARTLEDTVAELLRPMLREWLDANMPRIVEKALRVELAAAKRPDTDGSR